MITGDYRELKDLAARHICQEHGTPLVVAWFPQESTYVLRCGQGHYPDMITRQLSLTEMYKQGEELPSFIEDKIERRLKIQAMVQQRKPVDAQFALVPQTDLATGQLLLPEEVKSLVLYAEKYDLDPHRGHVVLMYGKPYITLDGYLYHAFMTSKPYQLNSRPLTEDEKLQYMVPLTDHCWLAEVKTFQPQGLFTGIGIVTKEEMEAKSPRDANKLRSPVVAAHPWQLAQKRAEWQALRRAFPIGETKEGEGEAGD